MAARNSRHLVPNLTLKVLRHYAHCLGGLGKSRPDLPQGCAFDARSSNRELSNASSRRWAHRRTDPLRNSAPPDLLSDGILGHSCPEAVNIPAMQLVVRERLGAEPVSFHDSRTKLQPFLSSRATRRMLRLDIANTMFSRAVRRSHYCYRGRIFLYYLNEKSLLTTGRLMQCRNVLNGGIGVSDRGIHFGEYGANPDRRSVPIWHRGTMADPCRSTNFSTSQSTLFTVYVDPYSDRLGIPTGDFGGECFLHFADGLPQREAFRRWSAALAPAVIAVQGEAPPVTKLVALLK
jgi:hypothetical protein